MFLEHFVKFYDKMVVGDLHHTGGNYIGFWSNETLLLFSSPNILSISSSTIRRMSDSSVILLRYHRKFVQQRLEILLIIGLPFLFPLKRFLLARKNLNKIYQPISFFNRTKIVFSQQFLKVPFCKISVILALVK